MNTRNRITLLLAAIMVVALLVVGMTLTASAADGDLVTEYGTVPAANANDNFAIFFKGANEDNYTFHSSVTNPFDALGTDQLKAVDGEIVVFQLANYNYSTGATYTGAFTLNADVIFDFGGKTFTATNSAGTGTIAFAPAARTEQNPVFNWSFKNGTVVTGKQQFILVGWGGSAVGSDFEINIEYNNVTFDRADTGASKEPPLLQVNKSAYVGVANVTYNDCTFDMTGAVTGVIGSTAKLIPFNANGHGSGQSLSVNIYVNGGDIYYSEFDADVLLYHAANTSTSTAKVVFGEGENGYLKMHLPAKYAFTTTDQYLLNDGSAYVVFDKITETGVDAKVVKAEDVSLETAYGTLPEQYKDIAKYPFVIFTKATGADEWTVHTEQGNALQDMSVTDNKKFDPWADDVLVSWWKFDGDVAILMRRDVDLTNRINCSNCIRPNVNLTIDLNGHTMIASEHANGTFFFATKDTSNNGGGNGEDHRYWTFKNGTVVTKSSPLIVVGHNTKITNNPTVNITFDNVTFDRAEGANKEQPFVQMNRIGDSEVTTNVTYNDCTFDISGEYVNSAHPIYIFTVCNDKASLLTANIVVNGGTIITDTTENRQLVLKGSGCLGTITFNKGSDGKPLQLVLPNGVENTLVNGASTSDVVNASNMAYSFYKTSVGTENTTYQLVPYWLTQYTPKTSVTLSTDLIYNLYLPKDRYMDATVNGIDVADLGVTEVTLADGNKYYRVAISSGLITAGDEIELVVKINGGGGTAVSATRKISVVKYAKTLLASNPTETNANLVKDMLAYVKAACEYANDKAETVAAINAIIGENYEVNPVVGEAVQKVDGLSGASLLLGDKPAFVFTPNGEYDINAYKFAIGGTAATTEITEIGGKQVIVVYAYAYAMTETVTYTIEGTEISGAYNLAAYLAHETEAGNANTVALVNALCQYSNAAKAYKAEQAA